MSKIDPARLRDLARDPNIPLQARADALLLAISEQGLDHRPTVADLIREADEGRALKAAAEEEQGEPLTPELFLAAVQHDGRTYAAVTAGLSEVYLPCGADKLDGLVCGSPVLVNAKRGKLVGRDGAVAPTGVVVTVESVPPDRPDQVIVRHHESTSVARLAGRAAEGGPPAAGTRVVYDPNRRVVTSVIASEPDGRDLLTPPEELSEFSRADLGAPHPVLESILRRMKMWVQHPAWMTQMGVRRRSSYLLVGPTGTGKTTHLKVLARELADFVEDLTGRRVSRLVQCDASQFYSQWFGETEARITAWFEKLARLGRMTMTGRDGRAVTVPLLVVMEEVEALFRGRSEGDASSHLFDRPLALLLQKLDALTSGLDVPLVFCSTTNRPDLLDAAARRRLGVRQVMFGPLTASQAASVLAKKLPPHLPLRQAGGRETTRDEMVRRITAYLYGPDPDQGVAEVRLLNAGRKTVCRRELVTGALLEQAVSTAIDAAVYQSEEAGELLGLDAEGVIAALEEQFAALARSIRPHNLREHCPDLFADGPVHAEGVVPLARAARRPRAALLR